MPYKRLIPVLLIQDGSLYKTVKFQKPSYVGDPVNAIRIFNEKEVDEIIVLDIGCSKQNVAPNFSLIEELAGECFMPLAYGGGIESVEQAKHIFSLGVEKVCIQTAALNDLSLIEDLSRNFGSQSIVVSVDIKKDWLGRYCLYGAKDGKLVSIQWEQSVRDFVSAGAGEIMLNSVDKDGTLSGCDIKLISKASLTVDVPLISVGVISSLSDIKEAFKAGSHAVAAGSFFVYYGPHKSVLITYPTPQELAMC